MPHEFVYHDRFHCSGVIGYIIPHVRHSYVDVCSQSARTSEKLFNVTVRSCGGYWYSPGVEMYELFGWMAMDSVLKRPV